MRQINKNIVDKLKFKVNNNNKKYKIKNIFNNVIYIIQLEISYLFIFYYLIFKKNYLKNKNILKLILKVQQF